MRKVNLAIVGATGLVGSTFLKVLEEKNININKLFLFASNKSAGKVILFKDKKIVVEELCEKNISKKHIDFALFSAGASISREFAPIFKKYGAIVIDNSSAFRNEPEIPLVVPEVNGDSAFSNNGIIANPNCSTIQCMAPLKALHDIFGLKSVKYSTYQAVSGSGMNGINDLERNKNGLDSLFYPCKILDNCIPQIDSFLENGYTKEEIKMVNESRKILSLPNLDVTATCVRVPVKNCHSVEIYATFEKAIDIKKAKKALSTFPNIIIVDDIEKSLFPVAEMANGKDQIFVGRIRVSLCDKKSLHLFTVADNIRKGAASNAIETLELLLEN